MTSFRSRCQVVSTELFPPVAIVPSAKSQFSSFGAKTYRHIMKDRAVRKFYPGLVQEQDEIYFRGAQRSH